MSTSAKIISWVHQKPMILIRFDETYSQSVHSSQQGFEYLTIVKPHSAFDVFKLPTVCLVEIQKHDATECYLATATRKGAKGGVRISYEDLGGTSAHVAAHYLKMENFFRKISLQQISQRWDQQSYSVSNL